MQTEYDYSDLSDDEIQRHKEQEKKKAEQDKRDVREKWKRAKRFNGW